MAINAVPWIDMKRQVMRTPPNPLDKSTVVSIMPLALNERKPTIEPGVFRIPVGSKKDPQILVVGTSSWWKELEEDQPLLEIPVSSIQIADSVVRDYCIGMLACDMAENMPGMFWLPGEISKAELTTKHILKLDAAERKQRNWYNALVKLADALWSRSQGNPLAIGDLMRLAAYELGIKDRPWLEDFKTEQLEPCPACGSFRNSKFPVCQHCKTIVDMAKYKQLNLQMAQ